MRIGLLLDDSLTVPRWQYEALEQALAGDVEVSVVAHCMNTVRPRKRAKFAAYYLLALMGRTSMRSLDRCDLGNLLNSNSHFIHFNAETDGHWQRVPQEVAKSFKGCDAVVRFGMNLIRDPDQLPVRLGVLSYHHGDPTGYRGRPAGFYEMCNKENVMGVVVQRLSNQLDGGLVLARANVGLIPGSYARTLDGAYSAGVRLLAKALNESAPSVPVSPGPSRTLPSNTLVMRQVASMLASRVQHLLHGAFREKKWRTGWIRGDVLAKLNTELDCSAVEWLPLPQGAVFVADPGGNESDRVYCEALDAQTGRGRLVKWMNGEWSPVSLPIQPTHVSYPHLVQDGDRNYLLPEIASVVGPMVFPLNGAGDPEGQGIPLVGLENERVVDPTLFLWNGWWYLFGSRLETANSELSLWISKELVGPYIEHACSPICTSIRGARMAGGVVQSETRLLRFGQDSSCAYGGSTIVHQIDKLSPDQYAERTLGHLAFSDAWGPHTVTVTDGGYWIDCYLERWSPFAGWRRLRAL